MQVKSEASAPDNEQVFVFVASRSVSVIWTVSTACSFSWIDWVLLDVEYVGVLSFASWTVTVTVIVSSAVPASPSETLMTTTQVLASLPAPQPGVSKSGALLNVRTPPLATLNRSWSTLAALSPEVTME